MTETNTLLRVGVVGCGGISQIIHIPILAKIPGVQLVALCDIDDRKTAFLSKRFDVPHTFRDIEEMFRKVEIDLLFILTPTNMHLPMAYIALRNGVHLFIERPAARNAKETQKIYDASQKADRHVMIGMQSRFRNDFRTIKGFMENKTLGDILHIRAEWLQSSLESIKQPWIFNKNMSGGGVLYDLGVQLLDTCWWITGRPKLQSVTTFSRQIRTDVQVEDFANVYLRFAGEIDISFAVSWYFPLAKDRFQMEITGVDGTATISPFKIEKYLHGKGLELTPPLYETYPGAMYKMAYQNQIQHYINFLTGREKNLVSGIAEAVRVMEMMDMIYKSLETGKTVYIASDED
ncbi:MAG: Gfo/Idh/MocA family oxidoreductase [Calditrichia bacterium]|nr:Gfo/Idh/MocA family oxidoreductase [Calditrichota bacterium]MCB9069294.1 Gfo/Idh/MocA family oxidoreductase [Calditrichia bacterium]